MQPREDHHRETWRAILLPCVSSFFISGVRSIIDSQKTIHMVTNPKSPFAEIKFHVNDC
ncbi:unnamed protein product [Coffea canephora]|uniref:DH200=94 genomic scaffold, scaffold_177 n=1 Tax=Coffea canephora TaxID=49390 RepID=A0A068VAC1_COFCA|nr:unnamed protein product [Coffea canephora]